MGLVLGLTALTNISLITSLISNSESPSLPTSVCIRLRLYSHPEVSSITSAVKVFSLLFFFSPFFSLFSSLLLNLSLTVAGINHTQCLFLSYLCACMIKRKGDLYYCDSITEQVGNRGAVGSLHLYLGDCLEDFSVSLSLFLCVVRASVWGHGLSEVWIAYFIKRVLLHMLFLLT